MTLWVWMATDTDVAHIEAGTYTEAEAAELLQLRRYAAMALVLCVICLIVQIALLSTSFYARFWGSLSVALHHLLSIG